MRTIITLITLLVATVGCTYTVSAGDLYKSSLGVSNWGNDTTIKGFSSNGFKNTGSKYLKAYEKENNIKLFELQGDITRFGETAFFIQSPGECIGRPSDCNRPNGEVQKRIEAMTDYGFKGNVWLSYSFYITDEYEIGERGKAILQFHSNEDFFGPMFLLQISSQGDIVWIHESADGMITVPGGNNNCSPGAEGSKGQRKFCESRHERYKIIDSSKLERNTWYDLVFNINFDKKDISKAFHKIWLNGELVHERHNQTLWLDQKGVSKKMNQAVLHFGIYGSALDNTYQSIYLDEIHFARKCNKLLLENLGYSCTDIEAQQISQSVPFMIEDRAAYYLGQ
tara:strand:+ start:205 stop:1221 length:1017 start_codon:yes stop_codon:yes gene_type:complete